LPIIYLVHFNAKEEDLFQWGFKHRYKSTGRPKGILKLRKFEPWEVSEADESLPLSFKPLTYIFKSIIKSKDEEKENQINIFITDALAQDSLHIDTPFGNK
jgi:hypothetical protein